MMASRLPTREEVAAARQASFDSIKAIIDGRSSKDGEDDNAGDTTEDSDADDSFKNGDRAILEALLIKSRPASVHLHNEGAECPLNTCILTTFAGGNEQLAAIHARQEAAPVDILPAQITIAGPSSPQRRATWDAVPGSSKSVIDDIPAPPPVKRARTENDLTTNTDANTSTISIASTSKLSAVNKGKGRAKKPLPEPWTSKDFKTRFPHPAAFVVYLNSPSEERHPIVFHKDAPLAGVRAHFVSFSKGLSKSMAVNMNHLFRLGGLVQEVFTSPYGHSEASLPIENSCTTHVIVYSEDSGVSMKFKDIMKALSIADEALLVGKAVSDGIQSTTRDVWVIKSAWLVECVKQADQQRSNGFKAKKLSEMGYLVECEGDKKRRKDFLLRRRSTASIIVEAPDMDEFHMPESQASTEELARRNNPEQQDSHPSLTAHMSRLDQESPMSFEDMALEIEMARNDLDQLDSDTEEKPSSSEAEDEHEGLLTIAGNTILAGSSFFTVPSKRKEVVESDECPSGDEEAYRAGKEAHKVQVTKDARAAKKASGVRYRCDVSSTAGALKGGPNEDVACKFDQLALFYEKSKLPNAWFRVKGYRTAAGALRNAGRKIETFEDAVKLPGIGEKSAMKLLEIVQTGKSTHLECKTAQDRIEELFTGIYGVGPSRAKEFYDAGMRTLDDVKESQKFGITLSAAQEIGLKYYKDINERIPRAEVARHYHKIQRAALSIDPYLIVECMGSFRRGQPDCGDIDIIVTRSTDDGKDHSGLVQRLVETLYAQGLVGHTLSNPEDWRSLDAKWNGLIIGDDSRMRRIDILGVPYDELGAALIYFTGNDIFNRSLRLKARHMGLSLNQRGLFKDVIRDRKTGLKLTAGERIASRTEREIFERLGTKWRPPNERLP